ncbi:MAG: hypothetical protein HY397_04000 [Candidatus Doudnabacteria bacterium]|nr:hypothetical protein [Candidatus Doudnabacteria bacterium]
MNSILAGVLDELRASREPGGDFLGCEFDDERLAVLRELVLVLTDLEREALLERALFGALKKLEEAAQERAELQHSKDRLLDRVEALSAEANTLLEQKKDLWKELEALKIAHQGFVDRVQSLTRDNSELFQETIDLTAHLEKSRDLLSRFQTVYDVLGVPEAKSLRVSANELQSIISVALHCGDGPTVESVLAHLRAASGSLRRAANKRRRRSKKG